MKLKQIIKKLLSKNFWNEQWKTVAAIAVGVMVIVLVISLVVGGQQDVGAAEAGEQVSKLVQNIRNSYKTRPDFWGLSTAEVIAKKIHPLDMPIIENKLIGYFGQPVVIGADKEGTSVMPTMRSFVIAYKSLSKDQCVALASHRFKQEFWLGISGISIINDKHNQMFNWSNKEYILPADKSVAKTICVSSGNTVVFHCE